MPFESTYFDDPNPEINAQMATEALARTQFGPVRWLAETGSTNDDLMAAALKGAPHGSVLVADHQTTGRGRRDRTWTSVPGQALQMSVLLRPETDPSRLGVLTAAMSVSAAKACDQLGCAGLGIKWPNDLVVGGVGERRKVAGVLSQVDVVGDDLSVVIGVGINVESGQPSDLPDTAACLDQVGPRPSRLALMIALLTELDECLGELAKSPDLLWAAYRSWSATLGTQVRAELDGGVIEGWAVDVSETGALIIDTGAASTTEIVVADVVSLRPNDPPCN